MAICRICHIKEVVPKRPFCENIDCKNEYNRRHNEKYHYYKRRQREMEQTIYAAHHHYVQENTRPPNADSSPAWENHIQNMIKYYETCESILARFMPNTNISPEVADTILASQGIQPYLRRNTQIRT